MSRSFAVFLVSVLTGLVAFGLLVGLNTKPTQTATTTSPTATSSVGTSTNKEVATSTSGESRPVSYTPDSARQLISVDSPKPGSVISTPVKITGQARGQWFFEASAPVVLVDWDGRIIAEGSIEADGEWMTEKFVPFSGQLRFNTPADTGPQSERGSLIIRRANPFGLPENDMAVEIPVRFSR